MAFAAGKTFAAQVALKEYNRGFGKVLLLPNPGEPVELCTFTYDPYLPLSFAVSPDGRYFSTGQTVLDMKGGVVMPLMPPLSMVTWDGSAVIGVRRFPFVGTVLLDRNVNIGGMMAWTRAVDIETVERRAGSPGSAFDSPWVNLSRAIRRREPWLGGIDDSGGADEIVRIEVR